MAMRPIAVLAFLTFTLVAGCSDGPAAGELVAKAGFVTIDGTAMNEYVDKAGYQATSLPAGPAEVCPPTMTCTDPSSNYTFHFMSLPEPSGDGYTIFQVGGSIGERQLTLVSPTTGGMYEAKVTKEENQKAMFERFELRMGSFILATASSAPDSQAFVASPGLSSAKVTGSFKGNTFTVDVSGLPGEGEHPKFVGRLYTKDATGNLTANPESFPIFNGATEFTPKEHQMKDFAEFHIHVETSKIYVYQGVFD